MSIELMIDRIGDLLSEKFEKEKIELEKEKDETLSSCKKAILEITSYAKELMEKRYLWTDQDKYRQFHCNIDEILIKRRIDILEKLEPLDRVIRTIICQYEYTQIKNNPEKTEHSQLIHIIQMTPHAEEMYKKCGEARWIGTSKIKLWEMLVSDEPERLKIITDFVKTYYKER